MTAAGIAPNVVSFSSLIAAAPDYKTAREVLGEMTAAGIAPDVVSFSSLIAAAPDYKTAREVLGEMTAAGIAPDVRTSTVCAIFVETRDQASEVRTLFREHHVAGTSFHSAVYTKLCKHLAAKELLDWAFSGGGGVPFGAFETAVASYRRQRKISDALRIASAFPYFPTCRKMFREEKPKSLDYLLLRFEGNKEPHNAAYALGIYYEEQGDFSEAIKWLALAQKHPQTLEGKKTIIQRSIEKLQGRR
jgi:Pentatricopeptide repeat domain